jgi:DNA-binding transcriptional regulator YiaG
VRIFDVSPLDAYLASALTGLSAGERLDVDRTSDAIARVCARCDIDLYEPRKVTDPVHDVAVPDTEVFRLDRERVLRADLLIYLAHYPSTGAGEELIFAHNAMVPTVLVAHRSTVISRMVTGIPGTIQVRYDDTAGLERDLADRLLALRPSLALRRSVFESHHQRTMGERIRRLRHSRNLTHGELAEAMRVPGSVSAEQLAQWESDSDLVNNLTFVQLRELATALDVKVTELLAD